MGTPMAEETTGQSWEKRAFWGVAGPAIYYGTIGHGKRVTLFDFTGMGLVTLTQQSSIRGLLPRARDPSSSAD